MIKNSEMIFANIKRMYIKTLYMELIRHHNQSIPFQKFKKPREGKPFILQIFVCYSQIIFFGDPKFWDDFSQKSTQMYVKTLTIKRVGNHGKNCPIVMIKRV